MAGDTSVVPMHAADAGGGGGGSKHPHSGYVPHLNTHGHQHHKHDSINLKGYEREKETNLWRNVLSWGDKAIEKKVHFNNSANNNLNSAQNNDILAGHLPIKDGLSGPNANVHAAVGIAVKDPSCKGPIIGGGKDNELPQGKGVQHSIINQRVSVDNPNIRTRTQLMAARRASFVPDISYDLDQDGVIGSRDYFVGRNFDKDNDDKLNTGERKAAVKALKNKWLDQFDFGHDQAGSRRPYPIVQRRGRILTIDNGDVIQETYPVHWNADTKPKHKTFTEIKNDRLADLKSASNDLKNKWDEKNPRLIHELPAEQEWYVEKPRITRLADRAEADHQEARVRAGLHPIPTFLNPERETKMPGLEYQYEPEFNTRSDLLQTRKDLNIRDLHNNRRFGEEVYVPLSVRKSQYEAAATKFRASDKTEKTLTNMKEMRRKERIEYDRNHFGLQEKIWQRYSDQGEPWFILQQKQINPDALELVHGKSKTELKRARSCPKADFKITETDAPQVLNYHLGVAEGKYAGNGNDGGDAAGQSFSCTKGSLQDRVNAQDPTLDGKHEIAQKFQNPDIWMKERKKKLPQWSSGGTTKIRYTTDLIKSGGLRDCPRLFDTLPKTKTTAVDFMPIEMFSSFDWIRSQSLRNQAEVKMWNQKHGYKSRFAHDANTAGGGGGGGNSMSQSTGQTGHGHQNQMPSKNDDQIGGTTAGGAGGDSDTVQTHTRPASSSLTGAGGAPGPAAVNNSSNNKVISLPSLAAIDATMMARTMSGPFLNNANNSHNLGGTVASMSHTSNNNSRPATTTQSHINGHASANNMAQTSQSFGVRSGGFQRIDQVARSGTRG